MNTDQVFLMQWDPAQKKVRLADYPSLPEPCAFGSAVEVDHVIYFAGGQSGQSLTIAMTNFWSPTYQKGINPKSSCGKSDTWPGRHVHSI